MALQAKMIDQNGKTAGNVALSEDLFGAKPREHLLFDAVLMHRASARQGTANTKTRAEVRGGGKKPFRQKRTGSARQGSSRSPNQPGGGQAFGPKTRSYAYRLPKKARRAALRTALSQKQRNGQVWVVKGFSLDVPKTKTIRALMNELKFRKALFVDEKNFNLARSVRNIPQAKYLNVAGLNVLDLLAYDHLVLTSNSLNTIQKDLMS